MTFNMFFATPLRPPYKDLHLRGITSHFYDSLEKLPVLDCLEDADRDNSLMTYRKDYFDARQGSHSATWPELVTYQKGGEGSGLKHLATSFREKGKRIEKETADKLFKLVEKSDKLLKLAEESDAVFELVEDLETLAYADIFETLLSRLNYWLQADNALWHAFDHKRVFFGPFHGGRTTCSYSAMCLYWSTLDAHICDFAWRETKLDTTMQCVEDKYLAELAKAGVTSNVDGATFRREIYLYVTRVKVNMERNDIAHAFGTAIHSFLAPLAHKV